MATLYIVATPIGNLSDITMRAVSVLNSVDLILAEDTRVSKKLLEHYNIQKPLESYHSHSTDLKIDRIIELLRSGKMLALISDAGTPGINDPGSYLISRILDELPETKISPIPGANAAIAALSVSGFSTDNFEYLGFPPHKKGRQTFFRELSNKKHTLVFYESKHRIRKALEQLAEVIPERPIMMARELTKQFETIYRGRASELIMALPADPLGEFVIVVSSVERIKKVENENENDE